QQRFKQGGGQGGQRHGRPGAAVGRFAGSDSLARSRLVSAPGAAMPLGEAEMMARLINQPQLAEEQNDADVELEMDEGGLRRRQAVVLDVASQHEATDRETVEGGIGLAALDEIWGRVQAMMRRANCWPAFPETAFEDARDAFLQALHLHRSA